MSRTYIASAIPIIFATLMPVIAVAGVSVADLRSYCTSAVEWKSTYCAGYIAGALDTYEIANRVIKVPLFCPDHALDYPEMMAIVRKWFADHPDEANMNAGSVVLEAMSYKFPCEQKKN